MTRSVTLDDRQRRALLDRYRKDPEPEVRFRSHIVLLLADGHTWATVAALLFRSPRTIDRWVKRFHQEGIEGSAGHKPGRPFRFAAEWAAVVVAWVSEGAPRHFGSLRSRWCCEAVAALMLERHHVEVSRETVRRWLHRGGLVYRRPRPPLGPKDPQRQAKLDALRGLLAGLPADETAVFQDEVDINTNPKIGSMGMVRGRQATVETPSNNEKRYLSGSIHWRTGQVFVTAGAPKQGRDTALFLAHLDELRSRLRRYRKIHVICDSAKCHTSESVAISSWEHRDRIDLHLLSKDSPDCNPIERVWWNLHDRITRDHRCETMEELLDLTFAWLGSRNPFKVEDAAGGTLTTRPIAFRGKHLFVNLDAPEGELRVDVLDEDGDVIAPFAAENCIPLRCDSTRRRVAWDGGGDLARLGGRAVKFRFHLRRGRLYSFWVTPDAKGASYGHVAAGGPGLAGPLDTEGSDARRP